LAPSRARSVPFPPLSLFFLSLSLSALVISSVCDGLSTLI
jgi:hypothetical protein